MKMQSGQIDIILNDETYSIDLMLLRLEIEEVAAQAPLRVKDGMELPTPMFLQLLSDSLSKPPFNVKGSTPTVAYQVWMQSGLQFMELKKSIDLMQRSPIGSTLTPHT